MKMMTADIPELLIAADLAEKGSWPVSGGWADQPAALVEAVRMVWSENEGWKAKHGIH